MYTDYSLLYCMYTDYSLLDATASEQLAAEAQAGGPTTGTSSTPSRAAGRNRTVGLYLDVYMATEVAK